MSEIICNSFSSCYSMSFHYKLIIAYLIIWNLVCTIYLLEFNTFALFIWPTCQAADQHSLPFFGFISLKETLFCMTFEVGWLTGWLVCVTYKFNLISGLTLHLGLLGLLLLLDCLRPCLNVHVLQLFTLSSLCCHWYNFKWFCVFLYVTGLEIGIWNCWDSVCIAVIDSRAGTLADVLVGLHNPTAHAQGFSHLKREADDCDIITWCHCHSTYVEGWGL